MKVSQVIAEIVSEFSGFHHVHPSLSSASLSSSTTSSPRKTSTASESSKHSLHITIGADEVPTVPPPPPVHFIKHQSSPTVSRVASVSSLHGKVIKLKRTSSSDSESEIFPQAQRKVSTASYRVIH